MKDVFLKQLYYIKNDINRSFIIVVSEKEEAYAFIQATKKEFGILPNDLLIIANKPHEKLKNAEVKKIHKKLSLRPQGNLNLACLIDSENLTLEAGNSLLKIMEEPPANSAIFIFCRNPGRLLPTIFSRCTKIFARRKIEHEEKNIEILEKILKAKKLYQKFEIVQDIINKDMDIKKILVSWIIFFRQKTQDINFYRVTYKHLQKYSTGINKKLFLENLCLGLK